MNRRAVHPLVAMGIRTLGAMACALALLAVGLAGCSGKGAYEKLCAECDCACVAEYSTAYAALSPQVQLVTTHGVSGPNIALAALETCCAPYEPARPTAVFIHGLFADHCTWRFVVPDIARDHAVLLIDLPGCGRSESGHDEDPEARSVYSIDSMAERVLEVIEDRLVASGSTGPVRLIGHSLGGAIILRMLGDPAIRERHGDLLERIDRVVLIAPLDVAVEKADPLFARLERVSGTMVGFASTFGVLRETVGAAVYDSVGSPDRALREEADKRIEVLTTPSKRRAMQAMLRWAIPSRTTGSYKPDWGRIEAVVAMYEHVRPAPLIVWGARDETLPVSGGYKIAALVPGASLNVIRDVKHSPQLEVPGALLDRIRLYFGDELDRRISWSVRVAVLRASP